MKPRSQEEAEYSLDEASDYNRILGQFANGEFGLFGDYIQPGLVPRLEAARNFWINRRNIGSHITGSTGYMTSIMMSDEQLRTLERIAKSEVDNARYTQENIMRREDDPDRLSDSLREFRLKLLFYEDLKKSCGIALKKSAEARLEDVKRAQANLKNK